MAQQDEVQNGAGAVKAAGEVSFMAVKLQILVEAPKASEAVQFYKSAFGAVEICRTTQPKRKAEQELPHIISAQLQLAGFTIFVSDVADDVVSPPVKAVENGIVLCLETEDVEAAVSKAVVAGAVAEGEIQDGDGVCCGGGRVGKVKDPYGFVWFISSCPKESGANVEA